MAMPARSGNELSGAAWRRITSRSGTSATNAMAGMRYAPRKPSAAISGADINGNNGDCSTSPWPW